MSECGNLDIFLVVDRSGSRLRGLVIKNMENTPEQGEKIFSILKNMILTFSHISPQASLKRK